MSKVKDQKICHKKCFDRVEAMLVIDLSAARSIKNGYQYDYYWCKPCKAYHLTSRPVKTLSQSLRRQSKKLKRSACENKSIRV